MTLSFFSRAPDGELRSAVAPVGVPGALGELEDIGARARAARAASNAWQTGTHVGSRSAQTRHREPVASPRRPPHHTKM